MQINKEEVEEGIVLKLEGWLDTGASEELKGALEGITGDEKCLIMDMKDLEYISSSGLRLIVTAYKKMDGRLVLKNVSEDIFAILKTTGLDKKLNIEK
ncbi:MAG: STAS domain-containing protein [Lachnospiraceae bacterium]|nr:STAS domain-containing protein [Lachnospiraceae bacterium]